MLIHLNLFFTLVVILETKKSGRGYKFDFSYLLCLVLVSNARHFNKGYLERVLSFCMLELPYDHAN